MKLLTGKVYYSQFQDGDNNVLKVPARVGLLLCVLFLFTFNFSKAQGLKVVPRIFYPNSALSAIGTTITSTSAGGPWNSAATWNGGVIPTSSDDVIIANSATVTVSDNTAACQNLTINGSLNFTGTFTIEVNGNWTNNGVFNSSTGGVRFKGATNNTINGSSGTVFNDIIVDKGTDVSSILDVTGGSGFSNAGTLTIVNGLFKISSGSFKFGGNSGPTIPTTGGIWVSGGTLLANAYTVTSNGLVRVSAGTANFGTNAGNGLEVNNLGSSSPLYAILDIQGGTINVAGRLFINNRGNLNLSNGTANINTVGLNNASNASFEITATSSASINGGSIIFQNANSGTAGDVLITSGSGTKTINGGSFQIGNGSTPANSSFVISSVAPLYNLSVANANASVKLSANNLTIASQLALNGGNVDVNGSTLILSNGATTALTRSSGYIIGDFKRAIAGIGTYTFPVGTLNGYTPVNINFIGGNFSGGFVNARSFAGKHPNNTNTTDYLNRYWNISITGISSPVYDVTATYLPGDIVGNIFNIKAAKYNAAWSKTGTLNDINNTISFSSISDVTLGISGILACDLAASSSSTDVSCFGGITGTMTATVTGGTSPFSYVIAGPTVNATGASTGIFTGLSAGSYTITVTDAGGCTATTTKIISEPAAALSASISGTATNVSCFGGNNGSVTITANGGTSPYTYSKDGITFVGTATFSGLTAGPYTVTVKDANGCTTTVPVTITQPAAALSASISGTATNVSCFGGNNGSVTITANGGTSPYTYSKDGITFVGTATFSGLTAGPYTITVKDANGCTTTVPVTITQPAAALSASISGTATNVSCFGGNNGSVTITANGGTSPYTYSKDGITFVGTATFSGLTAGPYTITVKDANGCTTTVPVTITQPAAALSASISGTATNVSCFGGNNGSVTITANGGTSPYTYSKDGITFVGTATFSGLTAGPYTITVKDANGCTTTVPVTITQPAAALSASISGTATNVSCFGGNNGSVTITANGGTSPYTYSKDGITFVGTATFSGLTAGPYTITVKDANGCTTTVPVTITQPAAALSASISGTATNVSCFGGNNGSVTITANGGTSPYTYSKDGITFVGTATFSGLTAGPYTITVKDANGCTTTVPVTITQPAAALSASISGTATNVSCFGGNNGSVTITANGGTSPYTYSKDGITFVGTATFSGLTAGPYTITVKDANGCTTTVPVMITQPAAALSASISGTATNVSCFGGNNGSVTITANGGTSPYTYSKDGITFVGTATFSGLTAGPYTITVKDANGCTTTVPVTITQPAAALSASISGTATNVSCFGGNNGSVTITANGGTSPYTYSKDGITFVGTATFSGLTAGPYTITVKDANGCTTTVPVMITQPAAALSASISGTATNVSCFGGNNGSVTITANGGTSPYTYSKDGITFVGTATFSGLTAGPYTITVKDANGCTTTVPVTITQPAAALSITSIGSNTPVCSGTTLNLTSSASGGTGSINYSWTGPNSFASTLQNPSIPNVPVAATGSYIVTATDVNGCTANSNTDVTIIQSVAPVVNIAANPGNNICAGTSVTFTANPTNGGTTPSYQWKVNGVNAGTNSPMFTTSSLINTDKVTVVMTSNATCASPVSVTSNIITMTVNDIVVPSVSISPSVNNICPGVSVTFSAVAINGGTTPVYQWQVNGINAGTNSPTFSSSSLVNGDVITVQMTSNAACAAPTTVPSNAVTMIVKPGTPATPGTITGTTPVCPATTGLIYSIPAVPNASTYNWSVPTGWTITSGAGTTSITVTSGNAGQNGNISVTATNSCGTSAAQIFPVTVDAGTPATPGIITGTTPVCSAVTGLTYSIAAVANASSYTWTVPAGWTITSGAGTTSITVTSGNAGQNGNITVTATNSCGTSAARILAVVVSPDPPAMPAAITGTTPVCPGITGLIYSVTPVANATTYTWAVPAGWTITSGAGTTTITVTSGSAGQNGNITVTAGNTCGTSSAQTLAVTVNPGTPATPAAITGTTPVCPATTGLIYSIPAVPNASTYNWTVPTGWIITSGAGTTSITVTSGSAGQNGNITVAATNPCGTSAASIVAVNVSPATPATPGIISGSTEQCISKTGLTYSITAVPNATSYTWTVPTGWSITAGQGTTNITVSTSGTAVSGNITVTSTNSCGTSSAQTFPVTINTAAPATPSTPSGPLSICPVATGLVYTVPSVSGASSYTWTLPAGWTITSGSGTNSITVTVGSSAATGARTVSVTASNSCGTSSPSTLNVTVGTFASVDAGLDQTVCASLTPIPYNAIVNGAISGNNDVQWTSSNGGTFTNGGRKAAGSYTPSAAAVAAGTVTLTITTDDPAGTCTAVSDQLVITFRPAPTASISGSTTICSGSTTTITFTGTANTAISYTINGISQTPIAIGASGTATLTTAALSANTTYTITSVAYSTAPTCNATASGSAIVTVNQAPTVNAGGPNSVCQSATPSPITLTGATIGGGATTAAWSITSGGGTLSSTAQTATPSTITYTPAANFSGTVTLTLTTNAPGACPAVSATRTITVTATPTVSAGGPDVVCQSATPSPITLTGATIGGGATTAAWSITSGGGTLSSTAQTATPSTITYTPAANFSGTVTLTLTTNAPGACPAVSATRTITVTATPTVSAGGPDVVCQSATPSPITLTGATIGGGATTAAWSITSGGGTLSSTAQTATPSTITYTPAANFSGTVTLTLTTNAPGACPAVSATRTITVTATPTVSAGGPDVVCQSATPSPITLTGATIGGGATTAAWSITSGGGTLSSTAQTATPSTITYTPAANFSGTVTLTLTTNAPGACPAVSATRTITVNANPTVSAGPDQTICSNGTATMAATFGGGASSGTWTTSGSGTFSNNSTSAIYTPSASDINTGTITLTYTTDDPVGPCGAVSSNMTLIIKKQVIITTQPSNTNVCASLPADLSVVAIGDGLTYQWYKGTVPTGTAVVNSANISGAQSPTLHFNQAALSDDGTYYVVISGASPCGPVTSAQRTLNVDQAIVISTQPATQTLCTGANVTFTVIADANGDPLTYQWRKNGVNIAGQTASTLTINNILAADAGNYDVVISGPAGYTCSSAQSTIAILTVTPTVTINPFSPATSTRCQGAGTVTYTTTATNSTGLTYSLDAASIAGGNTINSASGQVTYAAGWSGTTTITASAAGCNGPVTTTHVVTITPTVTINPFSPATSTRCQGAGTVTYTTTATNSTGLTYSLDAASIAGGNTINSASGQVTYAAGWSGTTTITASAAGCNGPVTTTHVVTITPTVTINPFSPATSTRCQGAGTVTYTTTATNSTGLTYSLDAASIAGGNTINSASGQVTYAAGWSGTTTITASAAGCNGPVTTTHVVTITPTVTINPFSPATSTRCQGAGTVTYTTTATNSTGLTYSLDAASIAGGNTINSASGQVTYAAGWSGTTTITASAAGCNGPVTTTHSVTINATSVGGTISPATTTLCVNASGGILTLSGYSGTIIRWESSTNGGATWTPIANTSTTQSYLSNQTTLYRAVIQSGTCPIVYSSFALISVIPQITPTGVANPAVICAGQSSVLTGSSGFNTTGSGVDGSFDNANPTGWCVDGSCGGSFMSANGDNQQTGPWRETNPHNFVGINYTSPNPKFAIANGVGTSTLVTPVFSLVGQSPASLDFIQSYILNAGSSAKIEISTDGGATYSAVLAQYTGPATLGIAGANSTMQAASISLANYIGQPNVRIKFTYTGADVNSAWVLDGVGFPGVPTPVVTTWTAPGGIVLNGTPVTVTPPTTTTYTLQTMMGSCVIGTVDVTVTVFQLPVVTTSNSCVGGGTVTFTQSGGAPAGTWSVSGGGTINASTGVFTPTTPGCFTATYKTPGPGCTDVENFVVYPAAPVLTAPANTCAAAFTLPTVTAITGFNVEYNIDGTGWLALPSIPTTTGCHTIQARYVLAAACGTTTANTPSTCLSNVVSVVIFPAAPSITAPAATCNSAFTLPTVATVSGFNIEYSINGGTWAASPTISATPGCYAIQARYVLASACGSTAAGATIACATSNIVNVVIFPSAPAAPTVNSGCGAITVTAPPTISGFTIQYSFDDGVTWGTNTPLTADNCTGYKIRVRYVTSTACGTIAANTASTISGCDMSPATVRKVDNTKPTLTCPTVPPMCVVANNTYTIPSLVTSDNCSANSALTITYSISGATTRIGTGVDASGVFNVGVSTITWTVKDECGNINTCTTQVTINPKPAPIISHN